MAIADKPAGVTVPPPRVPYGDDVQQWKVPTAKQFLNKQSRN